MWPGASAGPTVIVGIDAVGQVDAVARQRLVQVRHAVSDDRGHQRGMLLVFRVRDQLAVQVIERVPRVVVHVVGLGPEAQRRHAYHFE